MLYFWVLFLTFCINGARVFASIQGYTCDLPHVTVQTFASTDVAVCRPPIIQTQHREHAQVQVVQKVMTTRVTDTFGRLRITEKMTYCGAYSHSKETLEGLKYKVHKFSQSECEDLLSTNTLPYPSKKDEVLRDLQPNTIMATARGVFRGWGSVCVAASLR